MKIYWAGPLFTTAERKWNLECKYLLEELGHEVWLPQEKEPRQKTAHSIFQMDVDGIDQADIVVAVMDQPDPDSGTCWEMGYAWANKMPIVTIRTDFRGSGDDRDAKFNLMMWSSATVNIHMPSAETIDIIMAVHRALEDIKVGRVKYPVSVF